MLEFIRTYLPYSATELEAVKLMQLKDLNNRAVEVHNARIAQLEK